MDIHARIYIAGHRGLVGSALVRRLRAEGADNLLLRTHDELDLTNLAQVEDFFSQEKPEYVFLAAAKVGGIHANSTYPAEFIQQNLAIQTNVIHQAWLAGVKKLLFLGSSCIYPRDCPQPIKEEYLLTGALEPTNEWYAIAKIAGLKMCQAYRKQYGFDAICAMPTNLYGPSDNYHPENSHVIPGLIQRFYEAKKSGISNVTIWGTGKPFREFMYVDDLSDALLFIMKSAFSADLINIGSGSEITIAQLAQMICRISGYSGSVLFDPTFSDGAPRKILDSTILQNMGWQSSVNLEAGLRQAYTNFSTLSGMT